MDFDLDAAHPARHEYCKHFIWQLGVMGQGCKVAVIDSGVDLDWLHANGDSARFARVVPVDLTPGKEGALDESAEHHGSRVIRDILQSAPRAEVYSLRVYGKEHEPSREELCAALEWCVASDMQVVNLSASFYDECSEEACVLCRSINSFALADDIFVAIAGGDSYTLNERIVKGRAPVLCPACHGVLGWAVEGPEVVANRAEVLRSSLVSGGGLSFTTAKFTGGVALIRSVLPRLGMFLTRDVIRRTCIPLSNQTYAGLGFGRHCFLLALLYAAGIRSGAVGKEPPVKLEDLKVRSARKEGAADANLCAALQWVCATQIRFQKWEEAYKTIEAIAGPIRTWAGPLELALVEHLAGASLEALGESKLAADCYEKSNGMMESYLALPDKQSR